MEDKSLATDQSPHTEHRLVDGVYYVLEFEGPVDVDRAPSGHRHWHRWMGALGRALWTAAHRAIKVLQPVRGRTNRRAMRTDLSAVIDVFRTLLQWDEENVL